jgi:hypothetical protein
MDSSLVQQQNRYHSALSQLRRAWGGIYNLPDEPFFLFGMGPRRKIIYQSGMLRDARTNEVLNKWNIRSEMIVPPSYAVELETDTGSVLLQENESGFWMTESMGGTASPALLYNHHSGQTKTQQIYLPDFSNETYGPVLRVLHHDILINIVDGKPTPNFFVYPRPWYRDGAMIAMVLRVTGNIHLLQEWILGLSEVFDYNNGEAEADNLGQVLFLLSLVGDRTHPLVEKVLQEIPRFQHGKYIRGRTDGGFRPVYQTKWLKFGLKSLGLPDPYEIPTQSEDYSTLCWWDKSPTSNEPFDRTTSHMVSDDYPYLTWASDTFYTERQGFIGNRDYPLTWESNASQANYDGMSILSSEYVGRRTAVPHTWHAAEMFFRLLRE